jgi:hypothetical protein
MVWKNNLLIDDKPYTYDGFLLYEGFFGSISPCFSAAYFKDPRDAVRIGMYLDRKHFPQHLLFANLQCLRCGLCCKNHDWCQIEPELVTIWKIEAKWNLLKHADEEMKEIQADSGTGCNFCRKVRNKPYYGCKVHTYKKYIFDCKIFICYKSLPVAHFNFNDVDELINRIGINEYYALIEKSWNDDFDYVNCSYKTHRPLSPH